MLRGVSSPLSGDRLPASCPCTQRTSPPRGASVQCAMNGGSTDVRYEVNSPSHETEWSESPEDPDRSPRSWDGRSRHRSHVATAPCTKLPACEWERWPAESRP